MPAGNLLGEIGKGHKIAFNVLNYGRFKLAAMCSGGAQARRSAKRRATRRSGSSSASRSRRSAPSGTSSPRWRFANTPSRAMLYRTAGLIDARDRRAGTTARAVLAALEEFAIEASILKVAGSEMLDFVARRERADSRRQRLRARLSGGAPLPRRAREPHLRGHERDQPPARPGHAGEARGQGRPAAHCRGAAAAGRSARAVARRSRPATARSTPSGGRSRR